MRVGKSEASALRVVLAAGVEALREEQLEQGYAELAKTYNDDNADAERRFARDRHIERIEGNLA